MEVRRIEPSIDLAGEAVPADARVKRARIHEERDAEKRAIEDLMS